jgi:uncharacterized membrane protein YebE (DUF533 family)
VPLGLLEPQTEADQQVLEQHTELVLKAMINAAKADGRIDEKEVQRIVGKLQEVGADAEDQRYVLTQMQKPLETEKLISAARGQPELAAQIYAASLMAIEVDTSAEKAYLGKLASGSRPHPGGDPAHRANGWTATCLIAVPNDGERPALQQAAVHRLL